MPPKRQLPGDAEKDKTKFEQSQTNEPLGKKSIFWDPEWNPTGRAVLNYRNVAYPLRNPQIPVADADVSSIPLPLEDKPRFYKQDDYSATVSGASQVRDMAKEKFQFIPSSVGRANT